MIKLLGVDKTEMPQVNGPIFLWHSATEDCLSWLTKTVVDTNNSIAYNLYDDKFDVYLGCKRGTKYASFDTTLTSAPHDFWDFNTGTIGE